jgi:hypothetical protein
MVKDEINAYIEAIDDEKKHMKDKYAMRPTISAVATLLIATGATKATSGDYMAMVLIMAGLGLYAFKAIMYRNGFFLEVGGQ